MTWVSLKRPMPIFLARGCGAGYSLGKLLLAGQQLQQEEHIWRVEAVGLSEGLQAVLNDPQDLKDTLCLGLP